MRRINGESERLVMLDGHGSLKSISVVEPWNSVLSLGPDLVLRIRDLESGEATGNLPLPFNHLDGLFHSPEFGKLVLSGDDGKLLVLDLRKEGSK